METGLSQPLAGHGGVAPVARSLGERIDAIREIATALRSRQPAPRRERLCGIHNPWGHAAGLADAWPFLDLCEDARLLDQVETAIGVDIILWDSELHLRAESYLQFVAQGREGRYWPAEPLAGAVVVIAPEQKACRPACFALDPLNAARLPPVASDEALYVIRYMPATSHFVREARAPANWVAMEEQPLVNYATRPLWLVRGEDRAGNDFVTGFSPPVPRWAGGPKPT